MRRAAPTLERLPGACDRPQKLTAVHSILECLVSIDENYGHLIVVLPPQFGVAIDVHLTPLEIGLALKLLKCLLNHSAEMTSVARIHHHLVHTEILNAAVYQAAMVSEKETTGIGPEYQGDLDIRQAHIDQDTLRTRPI